jgi:chromatin remodeling complex protein RSC6
LFYKTTLKGGYYGNKEEGNKEEGRKEEGRKEEKVAKKKVAKKKVAKKKVARKKRKPNPAFMKPMKISDALAAIVGSKPLPRTEVTKKLWAYIKKHKLQDRINKRMINADENLKKVLKKAKVSMFEMTKLVSKHLS